MVTKDLESIFRNKSSRDGFFNNPKFYFGKSNWKKTWDSKYHIAYQNFRTGELIAIVRITTDILHHYYIWRVSKQDGSAINEFGAKRIEFGTKKEAIDFAAHYRNMHQ